MYLIPLGKLAVTALFTLLIVLAISGLIRAGTDIYYPPFASVVVSYIAEEGTDPGSLMPYQKEGVNKEKMLSLKAFKSPFGKIHLYTAYFLMFLIIVHLMTAGNAQARYVQLVCVPI